MTADADRVVAARAAAVDHAQYHRRMLDRAGAHGLAVAEAMFLLCLLGEHGVRSDELADRLGMIPSSGQETQLRRSALALYAKGLVHGEPRKRGVRTTYSLTTSGAAVAFDIAAAIDGRPVETAA